MIGEVFERYQCWHDDRIGQVINKEAVSVDRATFLATHAPLNLIKYEKTPQAVPDKSEEALLEELWSRAIGNRHTFVVVQGIQGTGKSHLTRWLKERFEAANKDRGGREVIILIERAYNTLAGTLRQIIESGAFDDETMRDQRNKLTGATSALSEAALTENIIDQLRVATHEETSVTRPKPYIYDPLEKFLLDYDVRQALKQDGGPIERIVRFLASGNRFGVGANDLPGFEPDDLKFSMDTLRSIRNQGRLEAKDLADMLRRDEDVRADLARYLNQLLSYAIQRTTALSATDLKHMFNELRRRLREQNRNLTLFVEDITAFTGLDAGLIDVLATQHTGESNTEFCRLVSVLGITDYYYNQHFPDNMKDRVTHRLTLNATEGGLLESDLLRDSATTADLAARYLNAMRLRDDDLQAWLRNGAVPADLPNACVTCRFRKPCHASFGAVRLAGTDGNPVDIGLYPFNEQALWTMYQRVDTQHVAHTPRTFLNSVIEYVLQSHGARVKQGTFPPPPREVGSDFTAPTLPLTDRDVLKGKFGSNAPRAESLTLFWGNRTVEVASDGTVRQVGGLPSGVFTAFDLNYKPIEGLTPPGLTPPRPTPPEPTPDPLTQDITNWLNGDSLKLYDTVRGYLVTFTRSFIDWASYGISALQVKNRLQPNSRFFIVGQAGRPSVGDYLTFERSDELAYVLFALAELNRNPWTLAGSTLGRHLAVLGRWVRREEARIVEFVRQPTATQASTLPLRDLALVDCLMLEFLCGELRPSRDSARELLLDLIDGAADPTVAKTQPRVSWDTYIDRARQVRGREWVDLMRGIGAKRADTCRTVFLQSFNRPQGTSSSVRFIDAAAALEAVTRFRARQWAPTHLEPLTGPIDDDWANISTAYTKCYGSMRDLLQQEDQGVRERLTSLQQVLGSDTPEEVFAAITALLESLRTHQRPTTFAIDPNLSALKLKRLIVVLDGIVAKQSPEQVRLALSGAGETLRDAATYQQYFALFVKEVERVSQQLANQIAKRSEDNPSTHVNEAVDHAYSELAQMLGVKLEQPVEVAR